VTRRVSSGAPWEALVRYSRAVAAGDSVFVADVSRWEDVGRAHGDLFGETMPATSMVEISRLIDPRMLVEVEAVAYKPNVGW